MKNALLAIVSACALFFAGCNSIGDKESIVAKVNGEPIYKEDYAFMMRVGNIVPNTEPMRKASGSLLAVRLFIRLLLRNILNSRSNLLSITSLSKIICSRSFISASTPWID